MPINRSEFFPEDGQCVGDVSETDIQGVVDDKKIKRLFISGPLKPNSFARLNELFFSKRPRAELFLNFGTDSLPSLKFLAQMPNVRRLSIVQRGISGYESLASLKNLKDLYIDDWCLDSFDFLECLNADRLQSLTLRATSSKKPSLETIARLAKLKELYIEGHKNKIEAIAELAVLERITLRSITAKDLDFLKNLKKLWSVDVKLGGTQNYSALAGNENIKYLELWQVKALSDLSFISTLTGLQFLFLESLVKVSELPDMSKLQSLRRVELRNMKGLENIDALAMAPKLEEFFYGSASGKEYAMFKKVLKNKSLKRVLVGFGSQKKNDEFNSIVEAAGLKFDGFRKFRFR